MVSFVKIHGRGSAVITSSVAVLFLCHSCHSFLLLGLVSIQYFCVCLYFLKQKVYSLSGKQWHYLWPREQKTPKITKDVDFYLLNVLASGCLVVGRMLGEMVGLQFKTHLQNFAFASSYLKAAAARWGSVCCYTSPSGSMQGKRCPGFAAPGASLAAAVFRALLLKPARKGPAAFSRFPWDTASRSVKLVYFLWYFLLADKRFANSKDWVLSLSFLRSEY